MFQYEPYDAPMYSYKNEGEWHLFSSSLHNSTTGSRWPAFFGINFDEGFYWGKKVSYRDNFRVFLGDFISDSSIILQYAIDTAALPLANEDVHTDSLGLALLDLEGNVQWSHFYKTTSQNWSFEYATSPSVAMFPDGTISVLGGERINDAVRNFFFLRLD